MIFIESQNKKTPEYNFLKAFIDLHFPAKEVTLVCMGGVGGAGGGGGRAWPCLVRPRGPGVARGNEKLALELDPT